MVIERFKNGDAAPIGERFAAQGRMLPDGVTYHASWVDRVSARCFQIVDAPDGDALAVWTALWADLIDFELIPITPSHEFWSGDTAD